MSHSATVAFPAKGEPAREQNEDEQLMELLQSDEDDAGTEKSGVAAQEAALQKEQKDAAVARGKARGEAGSAQGCSSLFGGWSRTQEHWR